ncbi:MAG: alpha/beta hydrolase [Oscillospiraceae bacterium]|nr:alpha/beta hydrolase [Oscillospiraceae bacterium]
MAAIQEFTYPSSDGVHQVHAVEWMPEVEHPRGVVQLVHGISEYMLRYTHFAAYLMEHGFVVVGNDHLGHGKTARSSKEYGFLAPKDGWKHLAEDVYALRMKTAARFPGLPYFMLGHSMGSFVARTYLIRWPGTLSGCILSGTGQESAALIAMGKGITALLSRVKGPNSHSDLVTALSLGPYNRQFKPNRTEVDWISRDTAVVDSYAADPLCRFVPTVGMTRDMLGGLEFIARPEHLRRMDPETPIYFFSGDQDPVGGNGTGVKKVVKLFQAAGVKDLTLKLYPGGRHEMLNEINRSEVYADTLAWLESKIPRH